MQCGEACGFVLGDGSFHKNSNGRNKISARDYNASRTPCPTVRFRAVEFCLCAVLSATRYKPRKHTKQEHEITRTDVRDFVFLRVISWFQNATEYSSASLEKLSLHANTNSHGG